MLFLLLLWLLLPSVCVIYSVGVMTVHRLSSAPSAKLLSCRPAKPYLRTRVPLLVSKIATSV